MPSPNINISDSKIKPSATKSPSSDSPISTKRRKVEISVIGEEEVDTDDQYDERVETKRKTVRRKSKVKADDEDSEQNIFQKDRKESAKLNKEKKKAYYPVIDLQTKHFEMAATSKEEKESAILKLVVNEVCGLEREELRRYFDSNYPDKSPLLHALENVLEGLPKYLDLQIPEDVSFKSEYTSSEKTELFELRTIIENQKSLFDMLLKYEEDPKLFLTDHGLPNLKNDVKDAKKSESVGFKQNDSFFHFYRRLSLHSRGVSVS